MEKSRPQLNLAELQQLRWLLGGLIGLVSAWTVFYMEVDALLALLLLTAAVPVFTLWPRLAQALPAWFHRLVFPVIVTIFVFDLWSSRQPLPAMIRLSLMLLAYRCISPRGRREDLQLILLALFVVVVTGVFTVSPAFVLHILFFTAASLALLLAVTLADARSGGTSGAAAGWEQVRWSEWYARVRAVVDLRVLALGGLLFVGVVGLSVVLFLALPRFEISNSFFLDKLIKKTTQTGFSEDVRFGEVNDIAQDQSMAFAVDVEDLSSLPAEPYWRMVVLDEYTGEGFRMSRGLKNSFTVAREKLATYGGVGRTGENNATWVIYYQPGVSRYLPLTGGFSRLTFGESQGLEQSAALRLAVLQNEPAKMVGYRVEGMDTSGVMRDPIFARHGSVRPDEQRLRAWAGTAESAVSSAEAAATGGGAKASEEPTFLELEKITPTDRVRLETWVKEIGGKGDGGADFARRAGAWLAERHSYSLNSSVPPGQGDVLLRWMASEQPGHCELFAGSLVLLARAARVPARLLTGFKGGVLNSTSGSIRVLNSDAHAWVEIWEASQGAWLRSDPTPGSMLTPPTAEAEQNARALGLRLTSDAGWTARMDGLRIFWYRRIVNFDQTSQTDLLRGIKAKVRTALENVRAQLEAGLRSFAAWARQPWNVGRVLEIMCVVGAGIGGAWFWRRFGKGWWLAWRSRHTLSQRRDPVRREASLWLTKLDRMQRQKGQGHPASGAVDAARAELLRLRFGERHGWNEPAQVFAQTRAALRVLRRERTPR